MASVDSEAPGGVTARLGAAEAHMERVSSEHKSLQVKLEEIKETMALHSDVSSEGPAASTAGAFAGDRRRSTSQRTFAGNRKAASGREVRSRSAASHGEESVAANQVADALVDDISREMRGTSAVSTEGTEAAMTVLDQLLNELSAGASRPPSHRPAPASAPAHASTPRQEVGVHAESSAEILPTPPPSRPRSGLVTGVAGHDEAQEVEEAIEGRDHEDAGGAEEAEEGDDAVGAMPAIPAPRRRRRAPARPPVVPGTHPGIVAGSSIRQMTLSEKARMDAELQASSPPVPTVSDHHLGTIPEGQRERQGPAAKPMVGAHPGLVRGSSVKVMGYKPARGAQDPVLRMAQIEEHSLTHLIDEEPLMEEAEDGEEGREEDEGAAGAWGAEGVPEERELDGPELTMDASIGIASRADSHASSFQGSAENITQTYRRLMQDPSVRRMAALGLMRSLGRPLEERVAEGKLAKLAPRSLGPLVSPGPGAYELQGRGRRGTFLSASYSFERSGRILDKVLHERCHSPGPVYQRASVDPLAKHRREPLLSFGRSGKGARYDFHADMQHNMPHYNPGPGKYDQALNRTGALLISGPKHSLAPRHHPRDALGPHPVYVSRGHERERLAIDSPGPGRYGVQQAPRDAKSTTLSYTMRPKGTTQFDSTVRRIAASTSSRFMESVRDRFGNRGVGAGLSLTFPRGQQREKPYENLSATAYKTEEHARTELYGLTGPGPKYTPQSVALHVSGPALGSGQRDRFYHRSGYLGQGRL